MKTVKGIRQHLCASAVAAVFVLSAGSANAEVYTVTVQNLTRGQHFTPPIAAVHPAAYSMFTLGSEASPALEAMAEEGMTALLTAAVTAGGGMSAIAGDTTPQPVAPGATVTITIDTGATTMTHLSVAGMLLPTNDGFVALNAQEIPTEGGTFLLNAYDAGSEANSELTADIPKPPFITGVFVLETGGTGVSTVEEGSVHIHRGVLGDSSATAGASDLKPGVHRWLNPVARVTVSVAASPAN